MRKTTRGKAAWLGALLLLVVAMLVLAAPLFVHLLTPVVAQSIEPVFGLRGVLAPATNQSFATTITQPNGTQYGIVGATPEIEVTLDTYAARGDTVKVWGTVQSRPAFSNVPIIVATSVVLDNTPITLVPSPVDAVAGTPIAQPVAPDQVAQPVAGATSVVVIPMVGAPAAPEGPTATISVYAAFVRSGPGSEFAAIGTVEQGAVCRVIGRAVTSDWLQLQCPAVTGWVLSSLYNVTGTVASVPIYTAPTVTPPAPTSTPVASSWRVFGYPNAELAGPTQVNFEIGNIDFNWGTGPAHPELPPDNFSLRFDRVSRFVPGDYQLSLTYDDGARLYVNGQLVINDWVQGAQRTRTWQGQLAGDVPIRIEYFDAFGEALLRFQAQPLQSIPPTPTPVPPIIPATPPRNAWLAVYYNNITLQQPAVFARQEPRAEPFLLNYEFSLNSPVPGVVNEDNWSARWQGRFFFDGGDYRFNARGNDGVRVYIDGIRVINAWPNTQDAVSNTFRAIGQGDHEITVDMYDLGGQAWVRAWWERTSSGAPIPERDR